MAQHSENLLLHLDSRDKAYGDNANAIYNLYFNHIEDRKGKAGLTLLSCELSNAVYPISSARQSNTIYFYENGSTGSTFSASISDNNYTGSQIATALTTAMNAAVGAANTYLVTYDSQSKKLTFDVTVGTSVSITSGTNSLHNEIGADTSDGFSDPYICANPVLLSGTSYIDIYVRNFNHHNVSSRNTLSPVYRIPLSVAFGEILYHKPSHDEKVMINVQDLKSLQIELRDDKNLVVSMPDNHNVSFTFKLTYSYY